MRVVCDTGPLLSATDRRDPAHGLAASLVTALGRDLLVPDPVIGEVDHLMRARLGSDVARLFLQSLAAQEVTPAFLTPELLRRAVEIDDRYADLDLGFADSSVMAFAERHDLPILTFDFKDFRAARPKEGAWSLVVDEARYREAVTGPRPVRRGQRRRRAGPAKD